MAKNTETKAELIKPGNGADALMRQAQAVTSMTTSEQLRALEELLGASSAEVEVIVAGKLPFWPALAGAMLVGTLQNVQDIGTKFGEVGIYTLRVEDRACLAGDANGELFELRPGELITVLERTVMKTLRSHVGQKVGIVCTGKVMGKNGFEYYDYRIVGKRRTPEEEQAAAQRFMAATQQKQLSPPSNPPNNPQS